MRIEKRNIGMPLMVLPGLSLIDIEVNDTFNRLEIYASKFSSISGHKLGKLIVLTREANSKNLKKGTFPHLEFIDTSRSSLSLVYGVIRYYRSSKTYPSTIIVGDPWKGFLLANLLKKVFFAHSCLQIQIHGKIYAKPRTLNLKENIKYLIVKKSLREADSIRVVSSFQIEDLQKMTSPDVKYICAPIPIDFSKIPNIFSADRTGISFIGRIHSERGLDYFAEIVSELSKKNIGTSISIVGDGPAKRKLEGVLAVRGCSSHVEFLGKLTNSELKTQYSKTKILLSCAPDEGYGLTLREALLSGAVVIARQSKGSQAAQKEYESGIFLFNSVSESVNLIIEILFGKMNYTPSPSLHFQQRVKDEKSISAWVSTW